MRFALIILFIFLTVQASAQPKQVKNAGDLKAAVAAAKPGDILLLTGTEWKDADLIIEGKGTRQKPVVIMPETPGLILSGNSSLKISGEFLVVKGLHFKNGFTRNGDVITFRTSSEKLANNCRLTETVIERFSKPNRFDNDNWIVLWGKNNRVDHCTFVNKLNLGPTLVVELNDERSQQNYHNIDSNYFKGRDRFGSNGGETIRVGVSKYSLTPSKTNIRYNYFERCNGEVEVVSVKSGENHISFNTFFECEGSLVLRHGNKNTVEGNLFLGNNKLFTGGIRVINPGHNVFNNVLKDLKGDSFRSALAVMNGVPNSLINRYHQVKDADIHHNTFINCNNIDFGTGKDAERTAVPENVKFRNNLVVNSGDTLYTNHNLPSGISFSSNAVNGFYSKKLPAGFKQVKVKNRNIKRLSLPDPVSGAGAIVSKLPLIKQEDTGAKWYKAETRAATSKHKRVELARAESLKLAAIAEAASNGDTIILMESGLYSVTREIIINKALVIMAMAGLREKPVLINNTDNPFPAFITIENGGSLKIQGIAFSGAHQNYADVSAGIRSSVKPMNRHYSLIIDGCEFFNFNESSFSAFKANKSTYADSVVVRNCVFRNISGTALDLSSEKDDKGIYNAEYVRIENSLFNGILGSALNLYRGGNDESTLGPFLTINHCTFYEVDNKSQGSVLKLLGVQYARINNCIFSFAGQGGSVIQFHENTWDDLKVDYCNLYKSGKITSFHGKVSGAHIYNLNPEFVNPSKHEFKLKADSVLADKSSVFGPLGANL